MRADFTIMEDAAKRDVMLAGPLVLIPLLRAVAFGWRQHRVAERAEEIAEVGALLYDRIVTIVDHFVSVGRGLDRTVDAYNRSVASFDGRLMPTARALKALHVNATKTPKPLAPIDQRTRLLALPESQAYGLNESAAEDSPDVETPSSPIPVSPPVMLLTVGHTGRTGCDLNELADNRRVPAAGPR
jgi:DNA anti-recombination protein RmuC